MTDFQRGDVVRLKARIGPEMLVELPNAGGCVVCLWYWQDGEYHDRAFPPDMLELVLRPSDAKLDENPMADKAARQDLIARLQADQEKADKAARELVMYAASEGIPIEG